jgi:hypothetical protein
MDNENIKRNFAALNQQRQVVQQTWDEIERYIAPYRGRFFRDERTESSIEWRRPFVYDSTAVMGSQSLAAHLHSSLTSSSIKWFDLKFRDASLNTNNDAAKWLDACTDAIYKTLNDSNFNVQIGETYQDLVDFGTSIIMEEVKSESEWTGIDFHSIPLKECFFEEDSSGDVLNFYRRFDFTPLQLIDRFGDAVPDEIKEMAKEDSTSRNEKQTIIFCIYRRRSIDRGVDLTKPVAPTARPWGCKYILEASAELCGVEGGYYEMPSFVPRWRTTSNSMWGNSPSMLALADTMTLNRLIELMINAAEKAIDPSIMATERGLISDLDLNPGGLTVVKAINEVVPFETRARFDVSYNEIERYRSNIREYYMLDQLMLPKMEGTPATATEINARVAQLERLIGPTVGRLQTDLLDPIINRTFNILFRNKRLPEMPQIVAEVATDLDIDYLGPLARSQQHHQVEAFDRWMFQIQNISQVNQDVLDLPDWDAALRESGYLMGVPAKFMKSKAKVNEARKEREAMQAAQMQAQLAETQGKANKLDSEAEAARSQEGI